MKREDELLAALDRRDLRHAQVPNTVSPKIVIRCAGRLPSRLSNVVDRAAASGHDDILFTISVLARTVKLTLP